MPFRNWGQFLNWNRDFKILLASCYKGGCGVKYPKENWLSRGVLGFYRVHFPDGKRFNDACLTAIEVVLPIRFHITGFAFVFDGLDPFQSAVKLSSPTPWQKQRWALIASHSKP